MAYTQGISTTKLRKSHLGNFHLVWFDIKQLRQLPSIFWERSKVKSRESRGPKGGSIGKRILGFRCLMGANTTNKTELIKHEKTQLLSPYMGCLCLRRRRYCRSLFMSLTSVIPVTSLWTFPGKMNRSCLITNQTKWKSCRGYPLLIPMVGVDHSYLATRWRPNWPPGHY